MTSIETASLAVSRAGRCGRGDGRRTRLSSESGFTLLEVIIVAVILALAAMLAGPSFQSGWRAREIRSATRLVAGTLRGLQGDAIQTGKMRTLVIDPRTSRFAVKGLAEEISLGDAAGIVDFRGGELRSDGAIEVRFYPNGSTTGLALLIGDRDRPREGGFIVRMDPLVGLVTVRDPEKRDG